MTDARPFHALVAAFPLLLLVFMPRPPVGGAHLLVFPAVALCCVALLMYVTDERQRLVDLRPAMPFVILLVSLSVVIATSELINARWIRTTGILMPLRPLLITLVFVTGFAVARALPASAIAKGLLLSSAVILFGQFFLAVPQALNVHITDIIYSAEKARGIGGIFRVTGSLGNPNTFGYIVIQATLIAMLFGKGWARAVLAFFGFGLIVASGSRSMLLMFPIALFLAYVLSRERIRFGTVAKSVSVVVVVLGSALAVIYLFSDVFRYQAQLLRVVLTGDLLSVDTVQARLSNWAARWDLFHQAAGAHKWTIGLGSREAFQVADNDYFYALWHYGLVGLCFNLAIYGAALTAAYRCPDTRLRALCIASIGLLLVLGTQFETIAGWLYPMFLFYLIGMAVAMRPA